MKIRKLTVENHTKVSALLKQAFTGSYEVHLFESLHRNKRDLHEWVCIHRNKVIAYIGFSNAYDGQKVCGLHLAPFAVKPDTQGRGVGTELLRFSLRQEVFKDRAIFVLGDPGFYQKFGFVQSATILCPFSNKKSHFLNIGKSHSHSFTVGYEPEFKL